MDISCAHNNSGEKEVIIANNENEIFTNSKI